MNVCLKGQILSHHWKLIAELTAKRFNEDTSPKPERINGIMRNPLYAVRNSLWAMEFFLDFLQKLGTLSEL